MSDQDETPKDDVEEPSPYRSLKIPFQLNADDSFVEMKLTDGGGKTAVTRAMCKDLGMLPRPVRPQVMVCPTLLTRLSPEAQELLLAKVLIDHDAVVILHRYDHHNPLFILDSIDSMEMDIEGRFEKLDFLRPLKQRALNIRESMLRIYDEKRQSYNPTQDPDVPKTDYNRRKGVKAIPQQPKVKPKVSGALMGLLARST